jgi:hypothetical protein
MENFEIALGQESLSAFAQSLQNPPSGFASRKLVPLFRLTAISAAAVCRRLTDRLLKLDKQSIEIGQTRTVRQILMQRRDVMEPIAVSQSSRYAMRYVAVTMLGCLRGPKSLLATEARTKIEPKKRGAK